MRICTGKRGGFLKELTIRLHSFQDVQELCNLSERMLFQASLSDGRQCVDISSMMQLFSLDLREKLRLQISCSDEDYEAVHRRLERLEVK